MGEFGGGGGGDDMYLKKPKHAKYIFRLNPGRVNNANEYVVYLGNKKTPLIPLWTLTSHFLLLLKQVMQIFSLRSVTL